jgi:serine/threonine-protein kinase RsbW
LKKKAITIKAGTSELYNVREAVKAFIGTGLEKKEAGKVVLAIDEALSNIIIHGYECNGTGTIEIEMESDRSSFRFIISDNAPAFNPLENPPPDIDEYIDSGSSHGLGIDIFKKTMEVYYEKSESGGNRLILVRQRENQSR